MAKTSKPKLVTVQEAVPEIVKSKSGIFTIPGVHTERIRTLLMGVTPLMCNKFPEKARNMILAKHKGEAQKGRERKDPEANFQAARYRLGDGSDGIPAGGVKAAFVKGFSKATGVPMTLAKGGIRIKADDDASNLVRIVTPPGQPVMDESIVRNQSGVVDIRHRPRYWPWALHVEVEFMPEIASTAQVLQAIAKAGFVEGLCEWRPGSPESLSGELGTWRIATPEEVEAFERGELFTTATNGKIKRLKRAA